MRKGKKKAAEPEEGPRQTSTRKLFDPDAPVKRPILPSQRASAAAKSAQSVSKNKNPNVNTKLQNLKDIYQLISEHEKYWADNPAVLDFKKRLDACDLYNQITLTDYKLAVKYDLDSRQWKNVVYNIFSCYRTKFQSMQEQERNEWNYFLNKAAESFAYLASELESKKSKIPVWVSPISHIGDICRYQAEYMSLKGPQSEERWKSAEEWYRKASFISPGNGLLWNQLGIVARSRGLYLSAIMNYMRALCVKRPFLSAKDSVLELFHFMTNEFDEKKSDSSKVVVDADISAAESQFLKIQSSLYTKVGLDKFKHSLDAYTNCLKRAIPKFSLFSSEAESREMQWWLQVSIVTTCNFFLILNHDTFDVDARKILMGYAIESMMGVIRTICSESIHSNGRNVFISIVLLYIASNDISDDLIKKFSPCWNNLLDLYYSLIPIAFQEPQDVTLEDILIKSAGLQEDLYLRSLIPFQAIQSLLKFDGSDLEEPVWDGGTILKRKARIILLLVFLSRKHTRLSLTRIRTSSGMSVLNTGSGKKEISFEDFEFEGEDESDGVEEEEKEGHILRDIGDLITENEISSDMLDLKSRMDSLQKTKQTHSLLPGVTAVIFDTNCYLNDFTSVKRVFESRRWKIIVPLIVVNELRGISQDDSELGACATNCLAYLSENITKTFQAQTYRGTILSSLSFLSEEWDSRVSNADDVILEVCKHHENVCLVTRDINLRLKARTKSKHKCIQDTGIDRSTFVNIHQMNIIDLNPGFDAEAREIEEWINQAPKPKTMDWKWKPSTNDVHRFKNILFAGPGISSKISLSLVMSHSKKAELIGVFNANSDIDIDWKDDHLHSGMSIYKCKDYYLAVCNTEPIYWSSCASAVASITAPDSKMAILQIEPASPNKESAIFVVTVGKQTKVPKESVMITGSAASVIAICQMKNINATCFQVIQAPLGFAVLQNALDQVLELFNIKDQLVVDPKKIKRHLQTTADSMFL